jgi:hypothetical protein
MLDHDASTAPKITLVIRRYLVVAANYVIAAIIRIYADLETAIRILVTVCSVCITPMVAIVKSAKRDSMETPFGKIVETADAMSLALINPQDPAIIVLDNVHVCRML